MAREPLESAIAIFWLSLLLTPVFFLLPVHQLCRSGEFPTDLNTPIDILIAMFTGLYVCLVFIGCAVFGHVLLTIKVHSRVNRHVYDVHCFLTICLLSIAVITILVILLAIGVHFGRNVFFVCNGWLWISPIFITVLWFVTFGETVKEIKRLHQLYMPKNFQEPPV